MKRSASSGCVTLAVIVAVSYQKVQLCELVYYNFFFNQLLDKYCRSVVVSSGLTTTWKLLSCVLIIISPIMSQILEINFSLFINSHIYGSLIKSCKSQ